MGKTGFSSSKESMKMLYDIKIRKNTDYLDCSEQADQLNDQVKKISRWLPVGQLFFVSGKEIREGFDG